MSKTFNIYCDESTHLIHDGHPYMLLGYTSIAYPQIRMAKDEIKAIYLNKEYGKRALIKKMGRRLPNVL